MREDELLNEFGRVTQIFNRDLRVIPTLYGSLGLWCVSHVPFNAHDIDMLVPEAYLKTGWPELVAAMEKGGYSLSNARQHKFGNGRDEISINFVEALDHFADVDYRQATLDKETNCVYYQLCLEDYQKVYSQSLKDEKRKQEKGESDLEKLNVIRSLVVAEPGLLYDRF